MGERSYIVAGGHQLEVERHRAQPRHGGAPRPVLVFLHEGLGCLAAWRDFPEALAAATGCDALVYSRWGYGGSEAVSLPRPLTYMHDEAVTLAEVLEVCAVPRAIVIGHSDGASIAILHAGGGRAGGRVRGLILEAAHVFCEDLSVRSIAAIRTAYMEGDLRERLRKHHGDQVDGAFWGWNRAWLDPDFRHWNIESALPGIEVPVLVIQGEEDVYGSIAQIESIEARCRGPVTRLLLPQCGHAPHKDQREPTLNAMAGFVSASMGS
ncbi:alpha/beta fold hydrolase [Pendulispora albinea]|uniref:Alpha/beta hydrolase n=1 Tax=Pendulispora albinea TaxID=2741071 RepID=A0ABZ2LPD5_9BACT